LGLIGSLGQSSAPVCRSPSAANDKAETATSKLHRMMMVLRRLNHGKALVPTTSFNCSIDRQIGGQGLTVGKLGGPIAALGIEKIQQTRSTALVGILTNVARVLRLLQVSGEVELDDLLVC